MAEALDSRVRKAFLAAGVANLSTQGGVFYDEFRFLSGEPSREPTHIRASPQQAHAPQKLRRFR